MVRHGRRILDCHIHAYPPEIARDPAGWARAHGEPGWLRMVAPEGRRSLQGWADESQLLAAMDRAGVERCVIQGWYWERQDTCEAQNARAAASVRAHPDRLSAFAAVQPAAGARAVEGLRRALDEGCCGIGELLPEAQGYRFEDDAWTAVAELAAGRGIPVLLHVTDPGAGPAAGPPTPLEGYVRMAARFQRTRFILAHWGGGLPFLEARSPEIRAALRNVWYDTAASPLLAGPSIFRRAVDAAGAARVLYGSDFPLLVHPRVSREPGFDRFLSEIEASGLDSAELDAVLGGNLRSLLGLR